LNRVICEVWFDDIAIHGMTAQDFIINVHNVLTRLEEHNFHLKPKKCHLGYIEIMFVGHLISSEGTRLSEDRISKLKNIHTPTNKKELLSFLSSGQYFHHYVPRWAEIVQPLYALTSTKNKFDWNDKYQKVFEDAKLAIKNAQFNFFIDYNQTVLVRTDSSDKGVTGNLNNVDKEGNIRPITFISHVLSKAAIKWQTIVKECFAIYYVVAIKFACFLYGIHFFIETDHRNLLYMEHSSDPKVQRMCLRLSEFNFTILHVPRESNEMTDWFSKYCLNVISATEKVFKKSILSDMSIKDALQEVHNAIIGHHGQHKTYALLKRL